MAVGPTLTHANEARAEEPDYAGRFSVYDARCLS